MTSTQNVVVTDAEWQHERRRGRRIARGTMLIAPFLIPSLAWPAMLLAALTVSGVARYPVTVGYMFVLVLPVGHTISLVNDRQRERSDRVVETLTHQLVEAVRAGDTEAARRDERAQRQKFESRLADALEMAEGEPEVIDVIERALATTVPENPVELLLADNSHAHLLRMARASPTGEAPGCDVDSPDHCPAARRAQVQHFGDSEDLDACPKLRSRPQGPVSALCMPVSIMGRTVGVIHATGAPNVGIAHHGEQDLGILAKLAGARIGLLRVMADTELQAATDSLTGLANRRSFEQQITAVRRDGTAVAVAMADLDHFKVLNDTFGHDTGDRALRLFAQVLRDSLRAHDLVSRHGGEEFVVAFPACTAENARSALDAMRTRLSAALTVAGLPSYTVSFGVVETTDQEDLPLLIGRADAALFEAKRNGRDQVVVHDRAGHTVPAVSRSQLDLRADPTRETS